MSDYPEINANGIVTQLGWIDVDEHVVAEASLDCGVSVTKGQHTGSRKRFVLKYPLIQLEEVQIVEAFFDEMRGRLGEFNFTYKLDDQTPVTWPNTRFDSDSLEIRAVAPRQYEMEVKLSSEAESPS